MEGRKGEESLAWKDIFYDSSGGGSDDDDDDDKSGNASLIPPHTVFVSSAHYRGTDGGFGRYKWWTVIIHPSKELR